MFLFIHANNKAGLIRGRRIETRMTIRQPVVMVTRGLRLCLVAFVNLSFSDRLCQFVRHVSISGLSALTTLKYFCINHGEKIIFQF